MLSKSDLNVNWKWKLDFSNVWTWWHRTSTIPILLCLWYIVLFTISKLFYKVQYTLKIWIDMQPLRAFLSSWPAMLHHSLFEINYFSLHPKLPSREPTKLYTILTNLLFWVCSISHQVYPPTPPSYQYIAGQWTHSQMTPEKSSTTKNKSLQEQLKSLR